MDTTPNDDAKVPVPQGTPVLVVVGGPSRGQKHALLHAQTTAGRHNATLSFDSTGVSERHAKFIVAADQTVMVMDLGSTNRTRVNGVVVELATLVPGDVVSLGTVVALRLEYETAVPHAASEGSAPVPQLSARQWEVARMVAQGLTNAEVGRGLCISPSTVSRHLENIYGRLGLHTRAALTRWVLQQVPHDEESHRD